jgi:hypothetical protein
VKTLEELQREWDEDDRRYAEWVRQQNIEGALFALMISIPLIAIVGAYFWFGAIWLWTYLFG